MFGADVFVGDDANVGRRHAGLFNGIDGGTSLGVTVIDSGYGFHFVFLPVGVTAAPW
jgi:hypothetical protein